MPDPRSDRVAARASVSIALDDVALMRAITEGDGEASRALYERHAGLAYGLALRVTRDPATAEDVVADAFLRVWQRSATYRADGGSPVAWLASIVRHRALDAARQFRQRAESSRTDRGGEGTAAVDPAQAVAVRAALSALDPRQRLVLELAYFEGLTQRAIAERTGIPIGTVSSHTLRGLRVLRRALRP